MIECLSDFTGDTQEFVVTCDCCEEEQLEYETTGGFKAVTEYMKTQGWQTKKVGDEWLHFGPDCKIDFSKYTRRPYELD